MHGARPYTKAAAKPRNSLSNEGASASATATSSLADVPSTGRRSTSTPTKDGLPASNLALDVSAIATVRKSTKDSAKTSKAPPSKLTKATATTTGSKKPATKTISSTSKQPDLRAMYMVYQQQVYLNHLLQQKKEQVLKQGEEELLQLWGLSKQAKAEADEMEARECLVSRHVQVAETCNKLEPIVSDIQGTLGQVSERYESLAASLECKRHQVPIKNAVPVASSEVEELANLLSRAALSANGAAVSNNLDYERANQATTKVLKEISKGIDLLDKCRALVKRGNGELVEELAETLEESVDQLKLKDVKL